MRSPTAIASSAMRSPPPRSCGVRRRHARLASAASTDEALRTAYCSSGRAAREHQHHQRAREILPEQGRGHDGDAGQEVRPELPSQGLFWRDPYMRGVPPRVSAAQERPSGDAGRCPGREHALTRWTAMAASAKNGDVAVFREPPRGHRITLSILKGLRSALARNGRHMCRLFHSPQISTGETGSRLDAAGPGTPIALLQW